MVVFSSYPDDPRPRRAVAAFIKEGAQLDLVCEHDGKSSKREHLRGLEIFRIPIKHHRGGKLSYVYEYSSFI